jgi:hypothetical protein
MVGTGAAVGMAQSRLLAGPERIVIRRSSPLEHVYVLVLRHATLVDSVEEGSAYGV